ncbi:MAG: hypothetical protein IPI48_17165 [bacterium]|nr:hypothetical protein [bacterium]
MTEDMPGTSGPVLDRALRDDVRLLGGMLGQVLSDLGGRRCSSARGPARRTARSRRGGDPAAPVPKLARQPGGLSPDAARES